MSRSPADVTRSIQAALLAWALPGAGHFFLGQRGLGAVLFCAISLPYWTGLAFGGIKDSINPVANKWLFLAEMGIGGYTAAGFFASHSVDRHVRGLVHDAGERAAVPFSSYYPESDVAQIYLATAGLLNLLAIFDAVARAQNQGRPTFDAVPAGPPPTPDGAERAPP